MFLTPGTKLGSYEIVAPLGAGGMGEVYRARDTRLGRDVAIKVLPADVAAHPDRLARFEREARTVAGLNHPNIVVLHSVEDVGGTRFLTMELVEGQSLAQHVVPGGMPIARVVELGIALADALGAAHERGVVHRDLKPANVMLTREGRVKVLDFGLAKLAEPETVMDRTQAATMTTPLSGNGQVLGTVPYMAPEQIRGETVDARSDIFALGIVLYELATGKRPFVGATFADTSSAILRDTPSSLTRVRADLPADLGRIVGRCLEKSPRERFQNALDVMNDLRALRRTLEQGTSGAPPKPASQAVASIAVLPFVNRSASADDEYFSDGLADELLNVLAKIKGLRVTARSSSFH
ncbi:MAG: serine/threonine-protein kinase, partial [Candidatus Eisenbacteria bacterium]